MMDFSLANRVFRTESAAILALADRLDDRFVRAIQLLFECKGRVIVTGMGKSGIISRKIAATLSSTGTPAFFLHPAEAFHGDLGVIQADDVVVALSQSGETEEIVRLLETVRRLGARLIALTGEVDSTLGQAADVVLDCGVSEEACPMNLVPTASTTAALAMGDALAMTLLVEKGFQPEDFANLHPGGKLGKRLLRVERLMHAGEQMPSVVAPHADAGRDPRDVAKRPRHDVRRRRRRAAGGHHHRRRPATPPDRAGPPRRVAEDVMTRNPVTIARHQLAVEALRVMEERKITSLVVVDASQRVEGVLHLHDLWRVQLF